MLNNTVASSVFMDGHCGDPKAGDGFYYVQMKKHGGGMNCMSLQSLTDL